MEVGRKAQSCGFYAGPPPPSVQRFHEHGHNKEEMLKNKNNPAKGSQSALRAMAWAGCETMRCLKGLKANLKPDQKDRHCMV